MTKLESCPFCKGRASVYIDGISDMEYVTGQCRVRKFPLLHYIKCEACGATTGRFESADMAIAAWNRWTE